MLVIPDYYDRPYVRDMTQLLLIRMGFKQLCVQQVLPNFPKQGTPDELARNHWLLLMAPEYLALALSTSVPQP